MQKLVIWLYGSWVGQCRTEGTRCLPRRDRAGGGVIAGGRQPVPAMGAACTMDWRSDGMPPSLHHSKLQKTWSHSIYIQFCCLHAKVVSQRDNKDG